MVWPSQSGSQSGGMWGERAGFMRPLPKSSFSTHKRERTAQAATRHAAVRAQPPFQLHSLRLPRAFFLCAVCAVWWCVWWCINQPRTTSKDRGSDRIFIIIVSRSRARAHDRTRSTRVDRDRRREERWLRTLGISFLSPFIIVATPRPLNVVARCTTTGLRTTLAKSLRARPNAGPCPRNRRTTTLTARFKLGGSTTAEVFCSWPQFLHPSRPRPAPPRAFAHATVNPTNASLTPPDAFFYGAKS